MKYCESCRALCESDCCSICENTELREVRPDDYCILTECAEDFGGLLKYTLADMDIPCALMPFGNGARSAFGLNLGNFRVFVPYQHFEASKDVLDQLTYDPTDELRKEGVARELVNRIQNIRKDSGLEVTDKIEVEIEDIEAVHSAVADFASYIGQQTLAVSVKTSAAPQGEFVVDSDVNEIPLKIAIKRA